MHSRFGLAIECALVRVLPLCSTPPFSSLISNILLVVNYCGKYLNLNQNFVGACSLALQIFPNLPITNNWHERAAFQRSAFGRSTAGIDVVATISIRSDQKTYLAKVA